jgi:hypothetical protein
MFSGAVRRVMARREAKGEIGRFGGFVVEYRAGTGDDFHFGVDYSGCGNLDLVMDHGGEAFAPYICMSDIALSDAMGWGLRRTQTLADGCDHCDFRFRADAPTEISSKTPAVQAWIERTRAKEV